MPTNSWDYVWSRLFDERTCLFYNYTVKKPGTDQYSPDAATWHLPEPELIRLQIPNPGGFGTGMEDCALSAGTMMDTVITRYRLTKDTAMARCAADIYKGMELLMDVSERPGFVVRGVSPVDLKSHYINSSRDQFTHWVWGAYILFFSPLSDEKQKESLRKHIALLCGRCSEDCVEENDWNILRDDGKIGMVSKMWGDIGSHEAGRLPMFYAAGWRMTDDERWKNKYLEMRNEAYNKTVSYTPEGHPIYAGMQLQYSLRLLYEAETDTDWKDKYLLIMKRIAGLYESMIPALYKTIMQPDNFEKLNLKMEDWRKVRARYSGFINGYAYYIPDIPETVNNSFYPLQNIGQCASVAALCPGYSVTEETAECIEKLDRAVDYNEHCTNAPIALLNAVWRIKESGNT